MDKQMQAFALGGLKDEGGEIDEASGNRVPIGGTKEGVRDDIPANVSEGEFIFPADVVRYHGLDKMMALRQEAKMGLKQMERMGQMGNSEEATMPDDLPFEMADLIVVGGQGEPMEFANGGFVPSYAPGGLTTSSGTVDLDIADVPMMGDSSTGVGYTPINYDDYMKPPVVIMKEYRNANGDSIIITYVNGIASTEIPAGYTLYTPPSNTAPTTTQAAIQTANNYSYQTSGGDDSDTPRELQVDPDYASMDNDTYFSTMERQNSFGGKAGNAAAMGIALAMGPLGLLTMGMLRADKKRQLTSAEQRIAAETNPTKKKAYQATFAKMGGKTKEPEEENALVKFGKGFVAAVSGMFGLGNNDVEKVASVAASAAADNTNVVSTEKQAPTATPLQVEGMGSPLSPVVAPVTSEVVGAGPTALPMNTFDDVNFGIEPDIRLSLLAGIAPTFDSTRDELNRQLETGQLVESLMPPAPVTEAQRAIEFNNQNNKVLKDQILNNPPKAELSLQPVPEVSLNPVDQAVSQPIITRHPISRSSTLQQTQRPLTEPSGGMDDTAAIQAGMKPVVTTANVQQKNGLTQRPLTEPSGGMDDTAAIQAGMQPIAQAAGTPTAGYDRQPVNRALFERDARGMEASLPTIDFFGSTEQFQARELLAEAARNEKNMPGSTKNLETALINRYGVGQLQNAGLLNEGQIYARPSLLKDGSFRPDVIEGSEILADGVTPRKEAPKSQVFFDGSMYPKEISPLMTPSPQPSPAIERPVTQTDALLGLQTDYGRRIASARGDNFIPESNVDVAGLGDYVPDWAKNAYSTQSSAYEDRANEAAAKILENNAVALDPNAVVPRADPVAPASTGYGNLIPSERTSDFRGSMDVKDYRGSAFPNLADTRQGIPINYVEPVSQPSLAPMTTSPSFGTEQRPVGEDFDAVPQQADPRQAFADNRVYSSPREEADKRGLSESQLTLGRARNASTLPDPYVASLNSAFGRSSVEDQTKSIFDPTDPSAAGQEDYNTLALGQTTTTTPTGTAVLDDELPSAAAVQSVKNIKAKAKQSDAARTSKGTSTRKAAPTGDDRLSQANFLERALGITPAKISARRGNDGVLYRTQADKREADKRQEDAKVSARNQGRAAARASGGQAAVDAFNKANAADIEKRHGGDKENSGGKIVCSAMNNAYGFGSFRNKIWLEHSKNNLTKEHQVGYHRMFLPLIHLGYNKDYKFIRKCLEHIARHRTADIYFQSKSNKRDTLGMVYRTILEPICYLVGMFPTSKDNK